jgi:deazaflavin-dependent oxidoreductase (nitroreductase family)
MPLEGEYEPSTSQWVNEQVEKIESSNGTEGLLLRGVPCVIVTSKGRKSGKLRKNPVMRVEHDGVYAAVASKGGAPENPTWYYNFIANPLVEVQDGAHKGDYAARVVTGAEREAWWGRAAEVWPDYDEYQKKTEREIPLFLLEPVSD